VTLDTTRADRLGCYGHSRRTSPHLDRFATQARVFTRAYSVSSWTLPAHASLFTGRFPFSHGARYDPDGPLRLGAALDDAERWNSYRARPVSESDATLAEILGAAGYRTGGVVAGPWLKRAFGLGRGFAHYDDSGILALNGRGAAEVTDAAIHWLDDDSGTPFFLFLNYFDPHAPVTPPEWAVRALEPRGMAYVKRLGRSERVGLLYDAEILAMDRQLGRLFEWLQRSGVWEDTWILVTADHGRLLGEGDRFGHGASLSEPEIRVPLLIKATGPNPPSGIDVTPTRLVDVLPTVLARLGLEAPAGLQGTAIPAREAPAIFAEVYPLPAKSRGGDWRAWIENDEKFVWSSQGHHELYDLAQDPGETRNLYPAAPASERLERALARHIASLPAPPKAGPAGALDADTAEALRGLGYLDEPAAAAPEPPEEP
jgi:arylsulfatase A-like enzyme